MSEHIYDYLPGDIKEMNAAEVQAERERIDAEYKSVVGQARELILRDSFCKLRLAELESVVFSNAPVAALGLPAPAPSDIFACEIKEPHFHSFGDHSTTQVNETLYVYGLSGNLLGTAHVFEHGCHISFNDFCIVGATAECPHVSPPAPGSRGWIPVPVVGSYCGAAPKIVEVRNE